MWIGRLAKSQKLKRQRYCAVINSESLGIRKKYIYNAGPYNDPRTQHQNREYRDMSPSLYDMIPNERNYVSEATHPQAAGRF